MDANNLIDAAKQQRGLTSDNQLALALGIRRERISDIRSGRKPLDEAEIFMLAEMSGMDPRAVAATARKGREKNPAKQAYWEKISAQFALAMLLITLGFTGLTSEVHATEKGFSHSYLSTNYAKCRVIFIGLLKRFLKEIIRSLSPHKGNVNNA